jgi:hypothetical protein
MRQPPFSDVHIIQFTHSPDRTLTTPDFDCVFSGKSSDYMNVGRALGLSQVAYNRVKFRFYQTYYSGDEHGF